VYTPPPHRPGEGGLVRSPSSTIYSWCGYNNLIMTQKVLASAISAWQFPGIKVFWFDSWSIHNRTLNIKWKRVMQKWYRTGNRKRTSELYGARSRGSICNLQKTTLKYVSSSYRSDPYVMCLGIDLWTGIQDDSPTELRTTELWLTQPSTTELRMTQLRKTQLRKTQLRKGLNFEQLNLWRLNFEKDSTWNTTQLPIWA
jgi:hypothetical protein